MYTIIRENQSSNTDIVSKWRLKTLWQIVQCGLFKRLEELHGDKYKDFMMSKLVPVVGNMCEPNLGISDTELATQVAEEVDVIVNSAANTTFDERFVFIKARDTCKYLKPAEIVSLF